MGRIQIVVGPGPIGEAFSKIPEALIVDTHTFRAPRDFRTA
jgi:hypothetical protein